MGRARSAIPRVSNTRTASPRAHHYRRTHRSGVHMSVASGTTRLSSITIHHERMDNRVRLHKFDVETKADTRPLLMHLTNLNRRRKQERSLANLHRRKQARSSQPRPLYIAYRSIPPRKLTTMKRFSLLSQ